jgi:metal-responsive CopG/Arc/MetJ family transcriptional regulator
MGTVTDNISFQESLLKEIDKTAQKKHRSHSEFLHEAARLYIQRQQQWEELFRLGDELSGIKQLTDRYVEDEINAARKKNAVSQ